jgi:hypothetical protein
MVHWLLLLPSVQEHVEGMGNGFSISHLMTPQAKKMDKDPRSSLGPITLYWSSRAITRKNFYANLNFLPNDVQDTNICIF